jgi:hypothetical protein
LHLFIAVVLLAAGVMLFAIGSWMLLNSRVPKWVKGIWKWPLGDNLSPTVARLMGWSSLLVGVGCGPTAVLVARWDWSATTWVSAMAAMFLSGAGLFPWVWSVSLSHSTPADSRAS